jgi:hypothetical protein
MRMIRTVLLASTVVSLRGLSAAQDTPAAVDEQNAQVIVPAAPITARAAHGGGG